MTRRTTANIASAARRGALFAVLVVAIWGGAGAQTVKTWTSGTTTVTLSRDGTLKVSGKGAMADDDGLSNPWRGDSLITSVVIDDGVTRIGSNAFVKLNRLTTVTIQGSVKSIGEGAFGVCTSLTSINVNKNNPAYISVDGVLFNKTKDTLIQYPSAKQGSAYTIPNGVMTVGRWAFSDCARLKSVTIPNGVLSIEDGTFLESTGLLAITLPSSVKSIGVSAFRGCTGLKSIAISSGLKSIGAGAFLGCTGLTSINVSKDSPTYSSVDGVLFNKANDSLILYPRAKRGAYTIPNGVKTIEKFAFDSCTGLTSVIIPNGVTTIGESAFLDCIGLMSMTIPNSVTTIGYGAFLRSGLTSVTIPNSVTKIEASTFGFCKNLTSVIIPRSVTTIIDEAFYNCPNLTSVTCLNPIPPIIDGDKAFYRIHYASSNLQPATLYVPAGSLKAYKRADGWGDFDRILLKGN